MKTFGTLRKDLGALTVGLLVLGGMLALMPLSAAPAGQKGNEAKGKFYFKQTCKSCHVKGEKGGEGTPLVKTQAQWQAYLVKSKHMKGTRPVGKDFTPEQLDDAPTVFFNHAVDSPQTQTSGESDSATL